MYTYKNLYEIAAAFREGIERAKNAGEFSRGVLFRDYPRA